MFFRWVIAVFCGVLWLASLGSAACMEEPKGPKVCNYEHECGDNGRCIFEDPSCVARSGQCKGYCQAQEPVPEKKCDCKEDKDCDFPKEGCVACRCVPQNVLTCKTEADCIRGWYCVGAPGEKICQRRSNCDKDEDCPINWVCRENTCCDSQTNRCPGACKEGTPCDSDTDCYFCNMRCRDSKCVLVEDKCAGVTCDKEEDCSSCGGTCVAGYCKASSKPQCLGKSCTANGDCADCGSNCKDGTCQSKVEPPSCNTRTCESDTDCTASGLASCVDKCCK